MMAGESNNLLKVSEAAKILNVPPRTMRDRVAKLPQCARHRIGRETWFDVQYVPGLKRKLAQLAAAAGEAAPVQTIGPRDAARIGLIHRILADAAEDASAQRGRISLGDADRAFVKRNGDGSVYGLRFSLGTLRRWRRTAQRGGSLAEKRGRKRGEVSGKIGAEAWNFFTVNYLGHKLPIRHAWELTVAESHNHGDAPEWAWDISESGARRRLALDCPEFYADFYRHGSDYWRAKHQYKLDRQPHEQPGNACWEIDGTKANVMGRYGDKTLRFTVVLVVDVGSGLIVGHAVGLSESTELVRKALWRAYEKYGAPKVIRMDRGRAFEGEGFADAHRRRKSVDGEALIGLVEAYRAELDECKGRSGWEKGTGESKMNVVDKHDRLYDKAYLGNRPNNRQREADAYIREHRDRLPTLEEYDGSLGAFIQADNKRPRKELGNLSPEQKFYQNPVAERRLQPDVEDFVRRRPQRTKVTNRGIVGRIGRGIEHWGSRDPRVWRLQGQRVIAYIDESDLSNVIVCDQKNRPLFTAINDTLLGISAESYREAAKIQHRQAKRRREYHEGLNWTHLTTRDVAIRLKEQAAELAAAKIAAKSGAVQAPERGRVMLHASYLPELREAQRAELRVAVGDGTPPPDAFPTLGELMRQTPCASTEAPRMRLEDLFGDRATDGHGDDVFKQLS